MFEHFQLTSTMIELSKIECDPKLILICILLLTFLVSSSEQSLSMSRLVVSTWYEYSISSQLGRHLFEHLSL